MEFFFTALTHILIVTGMLAMVWLVFRMVSTAPSEIEKMIRIIALAGGFLLHASAKRLHIDIPTLLVNSLAITNVVKMTVLQICAPALAGGSTAYFLLRGLHERRTPNKGVRILVFLTSLFVVMFGDIYARAVTGEAPERLLLPNLSFVLAVIFYIITRWDPEIVANDWRLDT